MPKCLDAPHARPARPPRCRRPPLIQQPFRHTSKNAVKCCSKLRVVRRHCAPARGGPKAKAPPAPSVRGAPLQKLGAQVQRLPCSLRLTATHYQNYENKTQPSC